MDRITCPSCRKKFEVAPGRAIKCPACKTPIAVTYRAPRPASDASSRRSGKSRDDEDSQNNTTAIVLSALGIVVVVALAIGGYFAFRGTTSRRPQTVPAVATAPERTPDVAVPKAIDTNSPPNEPGPILDANGPKVGANPSPDPPSAGPNKLDMPDDPAKGVKKVVRPVAGVTPESVQESKAKGISYLGATRNVWFNNDQHRVGYIALGGLTMVECKVHPTEPLLQQAADLTRKYALATDQTYEIAVAILFLDRMGDQRDRALIQTLGARLIAGQESGGGFGYKCPILTPNETVQLLSFVQRTAPRPATAPSEPSKATDSTAIGPDPLDPFAKMTAEPGKDISPQVKGRSSVAQGDLVSQPPLIRPKNRLAANAGTIRLDSEPANRGALSPRLQQIPAVVNQGRERDQLLLTFPEAGGTDQSNLQFAVLGLWVARRHGVVADRALLVAEARMRKLQAPDGRWEYNYTKTYPESMICAGMMSLAVGQAVHQPQPAALAQALANDTQITAATQSLGRFVANPKEDFGEGVPKVPIFFLWSVERVAVLFNLAEIDGKDWYGWGAQSLIKHQLADGSWESPAYPGRTAHVDTCFALLFLARSNLVQEISSYIQMQTPLPQKRR